MIGQLTITFNQAFKALDLIQPAALKIDQRSLDQDPTFHAYGIEDVIQLHVREASEDDDYGKRVSEYILAELSDVSMVLNVTFIDLSLISRQILTPDILDVVFTRPHLFVKASNHSERLGLFEALPEVEMPKQYTEEQYNALM